MGKKTNPNGLRILNLLEHSFLSTSFSNHWFSDINYSSLFHKDITIRKNQIILFMKYYKTRLRFFKGRQRNRRFKSLLRFCNKSVNLVRLPYKMQLLGCFHRMKASGLQKKNTAFILNTNQRSRRYSV